MNCTRVNIEFPKFSDWYFSHRNFVIISFNIVRNHGGVNIAVSWVVGEDYASGINQNRSSALPRGRCGWGGRVLRLTEQRVNMILFPAIMSMEIKLKHSFNLERKFILNELTFERIKNQFRAQTCIVFCRDMFHSFAWQDPLLEPLYWARYTRPPPDFWLRAQRGCVCCTRRHLYCVFGTGKTTRTRRRW